MARERIEQLLNLSDPPSKRRLMLALAPLQGLYRVELHPAGKPRSSPQNRYFHGVVCPAAATAISDAWGEPVDAEQAKELLKERFLGRDCFDRGTGELLGRVVRHTADLSVTEFAEFTDQCIDWLADTFGVVVPPPASIDASLAPTTAATNGQEW